ncbi:MAG TPA: threonine--tRNA ligase [Anaerolineae bacterium]|nr:threonine--tRNA ligase [Anaerolineae bacterium]HRV93910.1 threonine--tRNA ligase [Anaerolineae bacterium]
MPDKLEERYEDSQLYRIRHSAAHVMAQAVTEMFEPGEVKIAIGPPIDDGFYYDFDLPRSLTPDDLTAIEKRMKKIIKGKHPFQKRVVSAQEAKALFQDQPYKIELIEGLEQGEFDEYGQPTGEAPEISLYTQDTFTDLCRGPHVEHTGQINPSALKLMKVAGAYWRGDEKRPQLQRIYGTVWESKEALKEYLWKLEEARKRDHRVLGRELDLFSMNDEVGPGLILWHPKGGLIRKLMEDFWGDKHEQDGYDFVFTPHIGKSSLWKTSGHLDFYAENMYSAIDIEGQEYYLKPMNCPFHVHIFRSQIRSYRDLPLRFAEKGTVYRYERSGVLHGLLRVRGFTQDDAHHFCRPDQMADELDFVLNFSLDILRAFGLTDFKAYLSTQPEKSVGDPEQWRLAEAGLEEVLKRANLSYRIDEGGGAFYGPKIDLIVQDALGREWQISTIQFDFNLPERFDISYVGEDGIHHRPLMLHRALLGSMERFFGILIEHYGGAFPVWLAPQQILVLPIADRHNAYAAQIAQQLKDAGLRAAVDPSSDRISKKIRQAQQQKIPYMLIVGDREVENQTVSVRLRTEEDLGSIAIPDLIARIQAVVEAKDGL